MINKDYYLDPEEPHEFLCAYCDSTLIAKYHSPSYTMFQCPHCTEQMNKLDSLEYDYNQLLERYIKVSNLYQTLQDHLKQFIS